MSKTLVYFGGLFNLAFALFHTAFWRLFDWKSELPKLNGINRGVMQVLNLRLTYVLLVFAFLSFFFNSELLSTDLGRAILAAISLFWFARAVEQPIFWEFRSKISISFFAIFLVVGLVYLLPLIW